MPEPHVHALSSSRLARALWLALACVSLAIGIVGIVVPGLPTTPLVLLAAFAAGRGSASLHAWLRNHRTFGAIVRNWERDRAVSRRAKIAASVAMLASGVFLFVIDTHAAIAVTACVGMALTAAWLWARPEPGPGN